MSKPLLAKYLSTVLKSSCPVSLLILPYSICDNFSILVELFWLRLWNNIASFPTLSTVLPPLPPPTTCPGMILLALNSNEATAWIDKFSQDVKWAKPQRQNKSIKIIPFAVLILCPLLEFHMEKSDANGNTGQKMNRTLSFLWGQIKKNVNKWNWKIAKFVRRVSRHWVIKIIIFRFLLPEIFKANLFGNT